MPYTLDSVLVVPAEVDFVPGDLHRLSATVIDFIAAIDHLPAPDTWNGSQQLSKQFKGFTSIPRAEEDAYRGYVNCPWQNSPQSALICAQAVAQALEVARTTSRHWVEINIEIDTVCPDHTIMNQIMDLIRPFYLERAATRLEPAPHGCGDVVVGDDTDDVYARLKRIRPGDYGQQREAVESFLQRFKPGTGRDKTNTKVGNGEGRYVISRQIFPIRTVG